MRRARKIALWLLAVLIGLPLCLVLILLFLLNTGFGQRELAALLPSVTGGMVQASGISGSFPGAPRIAHLEVRDTKGAWLTVDDLALDWSPWKLIGKRVLIENLRASRIALPRLPESAPETNDTKPAASSGGFTLPFSVDLSALHIGRIELGADVAGAAAVLQADGEAHVQSLQQGNATLVLKRLDAAGDYRLAATLDPARINARLSLQEPAGGFLGALAGLTPVGALSATIETNGPLTALATKAEVQLGPARASIDGTINGETQSGDAHIAASAPAMRPLAELPGLGWRELNADLRVHGAFSAPDADGTFTLSDLTAPGGVAVPAIAAKIAGNAGNLTLDASIDGLHLPPPANDLFAIAPLQLHALASLASTNTVTAHLTHKLLNLDANATLGAVTDVTATLTLPDLAPFARLGNQDLQGGATLTLKADNKGEKSQAAITGTLGITGGKAPVPALIGGNATIDLAASMDGGAITLDHFKLNGKTIAFDSTGAYADNAVKAAYHITLTDLAALSPTLAGKLSATGQVSGPVNDLAANAHVDASIAAKGTASGPLQADINALHLPSAPEIAASASGELDAAPVKLALTATRQADGSAHLGIGSITWKSLAMNGKLDLAAGETLPVGALTLSFAQLDDLRPLLGQPLTGGVNATLQIDRAAATLALTGSKLGVQGKASVANAAIKAKMLDPLGNPAIDATAMLDGIAAGRTGGKLALTANGPVDALAIKLDSALTGIGGENATIAAALVLNGAAKQVSINTLQAVWKGQTVRLLAPAKAGFAGGVTLGNLRLGIQQAVLEADGRITPALDLTARLRNLTPDLAKPFAPDLAADGSANIEAKLTGPPAQPSGTVTLAVTGVRMLNGPARTLPAADARGTVMLNGKTATVDLRANAGDKLTLAVNGSAPLGAGALALKSTGRIDLSLLDPFISANGARVRGNMTLKLDVGGTVAAPKPDASITLAGGDIQDIPLGVHLSDIEAKLDSTDSAIRIASLTAKAGEGTISAQGTIGILGQKPVDIAITSRNARPLASDQATVDLDTDLTIRGALATELIAAGKLNIVHADLRVPDHLPASVATLNVRYANAPPPRPGPPPSAGPRIGLNLALSAQQIWVRGRGLDVELGGNMRVRGTADNPVPEGGFAMRRGTLSLAGQTLTFSKGEISFNGGGLADPALDFESTTSNGTTTATLAITGNASKPAIKLSSVPELPQDQVLAQILFHRSASSLSPVELAQAAVALASFSGVAPGLDPLDKLRQGLGLDRLSVGSSPNGSPSVTAGRYVAPGVFVGARQNASGGTQATVQVDLWRGLKAEATAGTGGGSATGSSGAGQTESNGSGVGLTYQFEY
jgi:translocation and assembly module TamB